MDRIFITGLSVDTIIGIYDQERVIRQPVILDLEMSADISRAAQSENVDQALNYKTVADFLTKFIENSEFQLIETMAERVTDIVRNEFKVRWVKLTLHKPNALPGNTDVGVIIERGERPNE